MKATHVVLRRFTGPTGELSPGDRVNAQGDGWNNARTLENTRYIRPLTPEEFSRAPKSEDEPAAAAVTKAPRGKKKEVAA